MIDALLTNAAFLLGAAAVFWLISAATGKVSFVDSIWGGAMAGLAVSSAFQVETPGNLAVLILLMTAVWGGRLFYHLLARFFRNGEDERYRKMLPSPDDRMAFAITALWKVWLLQAGLIMLVSSPAQIGILASGGMAIPLLAWLGFALWLVGVFFEWVGDAQLARFKADPDNKGKVMMEGLWRYTRHPNYFGDACVWWGIWLACASAGWIYGLWSIAGPIFLTFTLVKWSGAAMTESGMRDKYGDEFAAYVRRTSGFIPLPPRENAKA
ncbi:DUF1295 domain-containing protein [Aurantiacibacter marinus]|uniref:DUF1295 domain-containing protein n=1 Tax=Aurantiacibacter marinus TaxID=874156 RepID=UPI000699C79F|nr:DUF1295 domain-containing protein [Aurantiacibacter marinus]